jgi:hypothetical protein
VERDLNENTTVFIGRRRYYHGPTLLSRNQTQLIAERYSGIGAQMRSGGMTTEVAFLTDSNPMVDGTQSGFLASATRKQGEGVVGVHLNSIGKLKSGTGATISFAKPLRRDELDLYGEFGRGADNATLATLGAYLPGLYQRQSVDAFLEYGRHSVLGNSLSLVASKVLPTAAGTAMQGRLHAYATLADHGRSEFGIGASVRYGSK